ncbi:MAG: hypothetical protein ABH887_01350 [bacterium]
MKKNIIIIKVLSVVLFVCFGFVNQSIASYLPSPNYWPLVGDWNDNGRDSLGFRKQSEHKYYLDNYLGDSFDADKTVYYGNSDDIPIAGDWDDDGDTDIGFYRVDNSTFYLDYSNNATTNKEINYGIIGDWPIPGDWDGDGETELGVYRSSNAKFYLDDDNPGGEDDKEIWFGLAGEDYPVVGDWDGDGDDDIGVFRSGRFYLDYDNDGDVDDEISFGISGDIPIAGDWDDDGRDEVGVFRPNNNTFYLYGRSGSIDIDDNDDNGEYFLIVNSDGSGDGRIKGSGDSDIDCGSDCEEWHDAGAEIILVAMPDSDSDFVKWMKNNNTAVSYNPIYEFEIEDNMIITAVFEKDDDGDDNNGNDEYVIIVSDNDNLLLSPSSGVFLVSEGDNQEFFLDQNIDIDDMDVWINNEPFDLNGYAFALFDIDDDYIIEVIYIKPYRDPNIVVDTDPNSISGKKEEEDVKPKSKSSKSGGCNGPCCFVLSLF